MRMTSGPVPCTVTEKRVGANGLTAAAEGAGAGAAAPTQARPRAAARRIGHFMAPAANAAGLNLALLASSLARSEEPAQLGLEGGGLVPHDGVAAAVDPHQAGAGA